MFLILALIKLCCVFGFTLIMFLLFIKNLEEIVFIFQNAFLLLFFYHIAFLGFYENHQLLFFLKILMFLEVGSYLFVYPHNNKQKKIQHN